MEFGHVGFYGGRKTGEPGEKPSEQGREPTTIYINYNKLGFYPQGKIKLTILILRVKANHQLSLMS